MPEKDCCLENIEKAVRVGRASYTCPVCQGDVSLLWFTFQEALTK